MSLSEDYLQQDRWRDWGRFLPLLPLEPGARVLDAGCSIGTMAGLLAAQGAEVTAIDLNPELLGFARSRGFAGVRFLEGDLSQLEELNLPEGSFDGIWCSFVAAYFPDLAPRLREWSRLLKPGGWIALLEIDDLLAHQPLEAEYSQLLEDFVTQAVHYDFRMGRKLATHLQAAGFHRISTEDVQDPEFTRDGPVIPEVLAGWRRRLSRMIGLQNYCKDRFPGLEAALLSALADPAHTTACRVVFALGRS